jgi:hypothetical protein
MVFHDCFVEVWTETHLALVHIYSSCISEMCFTGLRPWIERVLACHQMVEQVSALLDVFFFRFSFSVSHARVLHLGTMSIPPAREFAFPFPIVS